MPTNLEYFVVSFPTHVKSFVGILAILLCNLALSVNMATGNIYIFFLLSRTRRITLTNFGLSKHLVRGGDLLTDQRGSLAYVSPDVLSGKYLQ